MRQKKKMEGSKLEPDNPEACVKCSKLQNGRQNSFEDADVQAKQTTLSTLKSVLKRSSSHKKDKVTKSLDKQSPHNNSKDVQIVPKKTKNRVQFDESQNKYFEADYVILIHEEDYDLDDYYDEGSPYDDEDDDGYDEGMIPPKICCSNPNCNNTITLSNYTGYGYGSGSNGMMDVTYGRGTSGMGMGMSDRDRYDYPGHYYDPNYEEINQNTRKSSQMSTNRCENEKCQNCNNYFDFDVTVKPDTSQDYGDQVTLSPPEGYKDGGNGCCPHHHHHQHHHLLHHNHHGLHFHQQNNQGIPACRSLDFHEGENQSDEDEEEEDTEQYQKNENSMDDDDNTVVENASFDKPDEDVGVMPEEVNGEKEKQENLKQRFIVETITMTTVTEQRIVRESSEGDETANQIIEDPRKGGILKGGKYWKNSLDKAPGKTVNYVEGLSPDNVEEEPDNTAEKEGTATKIKCNEENSEERDPKALVRPEEPLKHDGNNMVSPESTELTLTFKLGQHLLVANSLKPNSAMRQLFPSPRFVSPPPLEDRNDGSEGNKSGNSKQFLVTAESLRLFEEAKKSKVLGNINSEDPSQNVIAIMPQSAKVEEDIQNSGFQRTIERNTLRRSLVKYSYEFRNKRLSEQKKNENSLEERIRQLTCGIDDEEPQEEKKDETKTELEPSRSSPQGEESKMDSTMVSEMKNSRPAETLPSSSIPSSTSASGNSAYKKLTDLFSRKSNPSPGIEDINRNIKNENASNLHCDLVLNSENLASMYSLNSQGHRNSFATLKQFAPRMATSSDTKKQILSTLGPLTACVNPEDSERIAKRYRMIEGGDRCQPPGRESEYSIQDIEEGLKNFEHKKLGNQPDVVAETPQNETPNDELALFVQQDSGRMEKLKKRYSAADDKSDDDDDYGFNKRPLVKGIQMAAANAENSPHPVAPPPHQVPRFSGPNIKPAATTATTTMPHKSWPYYSQENTDPKIRQMYAVKQTEQTNTYGIYNSPQEYRGYTEAGTTNYTEYKGLQGQQRINYVNQGQQQNVYATTTNTFYRCHPVRFGGYSELSNYQFRHPPHSPPPMRRIMAPPQPSPNPEECKVRVENRVYVNRNNETYGTNSLENCSRLNVGVPDGSNVIPPSGDGMKTPESVYHRRSVPNMQNPCLQMKFSPVSYHQGVVPTASIRFSASCAPHPVDESNMVIEPHYSTFPNPPNQNTVGVIRVEQGQQMIRVPVPYAAGSPVQVHLMAGRLGRCDSPQRPNSPQGAIKVPLPPYNHYIIAKGTPTAQPYAGTATAVPPPPSQPPPPPPTQNLAIESQPVIELPKTVDFEKQGKAIAEELQQRQKLALSRSLSQEANHHNRLPPRSVSPIKVIVQQERGVPEGAASSSVQDCQPSSSDGPDTPASSTTAVAVAPSVVPPGAPPGNTIYYTMNI